ncbi:MAG: hypothetical protein S4CHLAM37_10140 [Chlamydiia bacterium]|nr:hypothetical protein [Chlamydiia bacterium]
MKKSLLIFLTLFATQIFAEKPSSFYLGPKYKRSRIDLEGLGSFRGNEWGLTAGYEYSKNYSFYANVFFEGTFGSVKQSSINNKMDMTDLLGGLKIGYVVAFGTSVMCRFIPYIGYGYHYIEEENRFTGFAPVKYTYYVPYLPFGGSFSITPIDALTLTLRGEYQYNLETILDINTLKGARWSLDSKPSWFVELPITWNIADYLHLSLTPFYNVFKSGNSKAVTNSGLALGIQPQSYTSWGGKLALSYHF